MRRDRGRDDDAQPSNNLISENRIREIKRKRDKEKER